jgi:hypothetical protein
MVPTLEERRSLWVSWFTLSRRETEDTLTWYCVRTLRHNMVFELRLKSQIPQLSRTTRKGFHQLSDWIAVTEPKDDRVFRYRKALHSGTSIWTFCYMSLTADIRTIGAILLRKMYAHWNAPLVGLKRINPTFLSGYSIRKVGPGTGHENPIGE